MTHFEGEITIHDGDKTLNGDLQLVPEMKALVVFAHGSGSSRHSPRNRFVAKELNKIGFGTLLADLLTVGEADERKNVFDIELLIHRLVLATEAARSHLPDADLPVVYFGASTGAAAALGAAVKSPYDIFAVVCRGGRPDLAEKYLAQVKAPTLLLVGGADTPVIPLNEFARKRMPSAKMVLIPGATHLFEESGALEKVVEYAADWFLQNLPTTKTAIPKENVVHEIEDLALPIKGDQAWNALIETLAKSRIVMLGEATHGSAEFYAVRRMITERLLRDHDFDFIAVEGDWPDCQKLNNYIRRGEGRTAKQLMRGFQRWPTWMWANDEVAAMIEWMQNYQFGFYGLDVYSLFESMDRVRAFAEKVDPQLAAEIKQRYACFEPFNRNEKAYAKHVMKFDQSCQAEVTANLWETLQLRLENIAVDEMDLFDAQQNARIAKNAEGYYRAMLEAGPESWNLRDHHMLETLELLLNRHSPKGKCIVWAHNTHIGDYHATDMLEQGYVNLGGLAREKFGADQVALVGFGTYQGSVLASPAWEGPETVTNLPPAWAESFEAHCHEVSKELQSPRFYMIFDSAARKTILGQRSYGHRAVGVVYHPRFEVHGRNYVPSVMAKRYDAFVYIDRTSAIRPVATVKSVKEFPETWPGGF